MRLEHEQKSKFNSIPVKPSGQCKLPSVPCVLPPAFDTPLEAASYCNCTLSGIAAVSPALSDCEPSPPALETALCSFQAAFWHSTPQKRTILQPAHTCATHSNADLLLWL